MNTSHFRPAVAAAAVLLLAAACSSGGRATWTFSPPAPTPSPGPETPAPSPVPTPSPMPTLPSMAPGSAAPTGGPQASAATRLIELEETVSLQIHQNGQQISSLTVKMGETLHFRITNTAGYPHNFYIGPADKLSQNLVSGLIGIPDFTTGSAEFDYTVTGETASLEWACTVPGGHYQLMHGTFVVEP